jgi:hypothetical protein
MLGTMRLSARLALIGLAVAFGASTSALGSNGRSLCQPPGSRTLARDAQARVFATQKSVFGCSGPAHRITRLGSAASCVNAAHVSRVALAGPIVAYGLQRCGVDTGFTQVLVRRLTDGTRLGSFAATEKPLGAESFSAVSSLVVKPDGAAAWIGTGSSIIGPGQDVEVRAGHGTERELLDTGSQINPGSLRLHGSHLSWLHGPAERSATLN